MSAAARLATLLALVLAAPTAARAQIYPDPDAEAKKAKKDAQTKAALQKQREKTRALHRRVRRLEQRLDRVVRRAARQRRRARRFRRRFRGRRRAGFSGGNFYLQSRDGAFRISPSLRLQADTYFFAPEFRPGARDGADAARHGATMLLRRARPELFGHLFSRRVQFVLAGELAELPGGRPAADAFLIFNLQRDYLRVQIGQFDLPFSLENRTSDRYLAFLERSFVVRNLGTAHKEPGLMLFGSHPDRLFYYSLGLFNGDGINLRNLDNSFDVVGRFFVRPLATSDTLLDRVQLGGSFSWGERTRTGSTFLGGSVPASDSTGWLSTPSRWSFFRTRWAGADGSGKRVGVVPEGTTLRGAVELNLPLGRVVARGEYIYLRSDTNEALLDDGVALRTGGQLEAHGVYGQVAFWPLGNPDILPEPGVQGAALFDATADAPARLFHLQLVVRFDHVWARYAAGDDVAPHTLGASRAAGTYRVWDLAFGVNLWWTRHLRLSLNYVYHTVDAGGVARLPAQGQFYLHELSARAALAL